VIITIAPAYPCRSKPGNFNGSRSISTTKNVYGNALMEAKREAMRHFGWAIGLMVLEADRHVVTNTH